MPAERPSIILTSTFLSEMNQPHRTTALLCAYTSPRCEVEGLDARKVDIYGEIERKQPIAVGVSVTTYGELFRLGQQINSIKKSSPSSIVIVGGRYPTLFEEQIFKEAPGVDILVKGYAEQSWYQLSQELGLLEHVEDQRRFGILQERLDGYPGIVFNKGVPTKDSSFSPRSKLGQVRQPDYGRLEPGVRQYFEGHEASSLADLYHTRTGVDVLSGLGCEHNCAFCVNGAMKVVDGPKELRPPEDVVDEIATLVNLAEVPKLPVFLAFPNSFSAPEHLTSILNLVDQKGLTDSVAISVDSTVKSLYGTVKRNPAILKNLKDRIWRVILGVESLDPAIQHYIQKTPTPDETAQVLQDCYEMGIIPVVQILIGLPPESNETLENSLQQLLSIRDSVPPFAVNVHRAIPFPGTRYYSDAVQRELIDVENKDLLSDITVGKSIIGTSHLTRDEVTEWIKRYLHEFYSEDFLARVMQDPRKDLAAELIRQSNKSKLK